MCVHLVFELFRVVGRCKRLALARDATRQETRSRDRSCEFCRHRWQKLTIALMFSPNFSMARPRTSRTSSSSSASLSSLALHIDSVPAIS